MKCPVCGGATGIYNSRPEVDCVRRSRKCYDCSFRFRTLEVDVDMLEAGFMIHSKDTLDLTEVNAAIKQLNDFIERVTK